MSSSRIPLPEGVLPPFRSLKGDLYASTREMGLPHYMAASDGYSDWIARVLTAYYADPQPEPVKSAPQFVVVRHGTGEMVAPTAMLSIYQYLDNYTAVVGFPGNGDEGYSITQAEYTRLKSILAPGQ